MKFELDKLPYETKDLEPYIGRETVETHYHKHHAGYMKKLANEIEGRSPYCDLPLTEIVYSAQDGTTLFRNAAQVWNHTFYWNSLAPDGGGEPSRAICELLERDFGSTAQFRSEFSRVAMAEFGSGWAWLVADIPGRLHVISTSDADNPMRQDLTPILALDVWEHAYYLDYRNERDKYVDACVNRLLNWRFAESNYDVATADSPARAAAV